MNTWTCKGWIVGLMLPLLAACGGDQPLDISTGLNALMPAKKAGVLETTPMAFGAVTLTPPAGYCVDGSTLKQRFALIARCERLGGKGGSDSLAAVITVSVTPALGENPIPSPDVFASAHALDDVSDVSALNNGYVFRARSETVNADAASRHWRGAAIAGGQVLGIALYGPQDSRAISEEGGQLLRSLIQHTQEKSK